MGNEINNYAYENTRMFFRGSDLQKYNFSVHFVSLVDCLLFCEKPVKYSKHISIIPF